MTSVPGLVLAADHRARGVITIEPYGVFVAALTDALPHCDGILATYQPLVDLSRTGAVTNEHRTYLSINRTGLAGSSFELDDRLVARVSTAAEQGWTGIKHMTRIDLSNPLTAAALSLLGEVLEEARSNSLDALIEPLTWRDGKIAKDVGDIVYAAVIAADMGAPLLKVPVPDAPTGDARAEAVARIVAAAGVPVLFLGGPRGDADGTRIFDEARDVMAGGGAGMAVGRSVYQDPSPGVVAKQLAEIINAGRSQHDPVSP